MTTQPEIKPLTIKGKQYITVADRVKLAHAAGGFSILSQERYELGGRYFFSVCIDVGGMGYYGDAEIKFDAKAGPDATNPLECAQTSAVGRALGFAGLGTIESIASADEVVRSVAAETSTSTPAQASQVSVTPSSSNGELAITEQQRASITKLCQHLGKSEPSTDGMTYEAAKTLLQQLSAEYRTRQQQHKKSA